MIHFGLGPFQLSNFRRTWSMVGALRPRSTSSQDISREPSLALYIVFVQLHAAKANLHNGAGESVSSSATGYA